MRKGAWIGVLAMLGTGGCTGKDEQTANVATPARAQDASAVADALRGNGLPVTDVVAVTPATDPDKLLGRPGQYGSKVTFHDRRHPGDENVIEVFASFADAMRRAEDVSRAAPGADASDHQLLQGKAYVRLAATLTPAEVEEYRKVALGRQIGL